MLQRNLGPSESSIPPKLVDQVIDGLLARAKISSPPQLLKGDPVFQKAQSGAPDHAYPLLSPQSTSITWPRLLLAVAGVLVTKDRHQTLPPLITTPLL